MKSDVLTDAVGRIWKARALVPWYAGDFSPIRTDQVSQLLKGLRCRVAAYPFRSSHIAMTAPPLYDPEHIQPIFINQNAARVDQRFAIRHEIGHVISQEAGVFMAETGYMAQQERAADLFALADLVPARVIRYMRDHRASWRDVLTEVRGAIETYASSWPADRLDDRAALRVALYRDQKI